MKKVTKKQELKDLEGKLLDLMRTREGDMTTNQYGWISDDLDYVDVWYHRQDPDGDRQTEYAQEKRKKMTASEAIKLLTVRLNNTLDAIDPQEINIKTIDIIALEWFDRVNGNSYFAGIITLNFGLPDVKEFKMTFQYVTEIIIEIWPLINWLTKK